MSECVIVCWCVDATLDSKSMRARAIQRRKGKSCDLLLRLQRPVLRLTASSSTGHEGLSVYLYIEERVIFPHSPPSLPPFLVNPVSPSLPFLSPFAMFSYTYNYISSVCSNRWEKDLMWCVKYTVTVWHLVSKVTITTTNHIAAGHKPRIPMCPR